jgi:hypothetical protein
MSCNLYVHIQTCCKLCQCNSDNYAPLQSHSNSRIFHIRHNIFIKSDHNIFVNHCFMFIIESSRSLIYDKLHDETFLLDFTWHLQTFRDNFFSWDLEYRLVKYL